MLLRDLFGRWGLEVEQDGTAPHVQGLVNGVHVAADRMAAYLAEHDRGEWLCPNVAADRPSAD